MKTIYNTFVNVKSKDDFKKLFDHCFNAGLQTVSNPLGSHDKFRFSDRYGFGNWFTARNKTEVSEQEFLELLKSELTTPKH